MNIKIVVHPNAKKPRIEKDLFGALQVYVSEPPLDGRANQAVVAALAGHFQVKKYQIKITQGLKSKYKTCEIL